jgi:hypothetical protein
VATSRRVFNYDYIHPAWRNHEELLTHNNHECTVYATEFDRFDIVRVVFDDGFDANVFSYELEGIK